MTKFNAGDRVRFISTSPGTAAKAGATATVTGYTRAYGKTYLSVKWDRDNDLHNGQMDGGYHEADFEALAAAVPAPKARKIKPGSQSDMLLKHLLQGKTITRIQADHLYRIASLTRRICDLKAAGHNIKAVTKIDPTGRPYVEYSLLTRDRFGNQKKAA